MEATTSKGSSFVRGTISLIWYNWRQVYEVIRNKRRSYSLPFDGSHKMGTAVYTQKDPAAQRCIYELHQLGRVPGTVALIKSRRTPDTLSWLQRQGLIVSFCQYSEWFHRPTMSDWGKWITFEPFDIHTAFQLHGSLSQLGRMPWFRTPSFVNNLLGWC